MERVNVYIDGMNFFHGLKKMRYTDPDWQKFYWLDVVKFFDHFILPGQTLQKVFYFSAIDHVQMRSIRQFKLFSAIKLVNPDRFEVIYGKYYKKSLKCKICTSRYNTHEEKRTDVNVCAYMMSDCALNNVDAIMLVTADSDLITPIELIRRDYPNKNLRLFFPPLTNSRELTNIMKVIRKEPIHLSNHKQKFVNSLLPDVVSKNGTSFAIPEKWNMPYIPPVLSNAVPANLMDLYAKHFGSAQIIEFDHPNMSAFINDLNNYTAG
jgi:uncharacterized LabA/DUF88 family protein